MLELIAKISSELQIKDYQIASAIKLLFEEECTIPFVARYRKEMTGSLDEVDLRKIRNRYEYLRELEDNKVKYLKVVAAHCQKDEALKNKFAEIKAQFLACETKQELEDCYMPFKPKRRTRAQVAREKGLVALLDLIMANKNDLTDLEAVAKNFVTSTDDARKRVKDPQEALTGAADILAEQISETAAYRALVRKLSNDSGVITATKVEDKTVKNKLTNVKGKGRKKDASKYENYFSYREPIQKAQAHRIMAVRRGESEKILKVTIDVDANQIIRALQEEIIGSEKMTRSVHEFIVKAIEDAYKRLLGPAIESELRLNLKAMAEEEAIRVFSKNLQNLLLLPPLPQTIVMGVDPGLRTGSKIAIVSDTGTLLNSTTIYPDFDKQDAQKTQKAKAAIVEFIKNHTVQYVAVGNGTGGREIDRFITTTLKEAEIKGIKRVTVNEAGASVYSTDPIAREEFPDLDATIRSAISIARRLQDPLAELVKIDPRSIGVGQYQHDVNVTKLKTSLEDVVESCVNKVGVNLNTASHKLLGYVSGIGPTLAKSIVTYRDKHGKFNNRQAVMAVAGFGPKAFQQAAGFLRIPDAQNPLDNSAVHPEQYEIVEKVAGTLNKNIDDIIGDQKTIDAIPWENFISNSIGMPTLQDIASELIKPGRDPREEGSRLFFSDEVSEITDLKLGQKLQGTVTNVTNFGAFVDIGVHQDGLVHISELAETFVNDPSSVVSVGDILNVWVIDVDNKRSRISLSLSRLQSKSPSSKGSAAIRPIKTNNQKGCVSA